MGIFCTTCDDGFTFKYEHSTLCHETCNATQMQNGYGCANKYNAGSSCEGDYQCLSGKCKGNYCCDESVAAELRNLYFRERNLQFLKDARRELQLGQ